MGLAISNNDFEVIDDYYNDFEDKYKFSNVMQVINDLGDFGKDVDKNVKSYQDLFSDIRNGVVTLPVYELIDKKIIKKALNSKKVSNGRLWRWKVRKLIENHNIDEKVISLANESYLLHSDFYKKYTDKPNPLLMKSYSMLTNNKYFNQEVVKQSGLGLRSQVILCDKNGREKGLYDKILVHQEGKLHKAFSVFLYNKKGELLIQQRADNKYHSGGLWANSCCSHYVSGENIFETIQKRLKEELGFGCGVKKRFSFVYNLDVGGNMKEHEFDTVFEGKYDGNIELNPEEAKAYKWISIEELEKDIKEKPETYAPWFKKILERMGIVK
jgi:isopentenyl-diphosphate delta-isomerase